MSWTTHGNKRMERFLTCPADEVFFGGAAGGGKFQPLDALVWTPFGSKKMAAIEIGDQVSNPQGGVSRVIGVFPQGIQKVFRLTFDDGASCEAGEDHLWWVRQSRIRRFKKLPVGGETWIVATTKQISEWLKAGRKLLFPITRPVEFTVTSRCAKTRWPVPAYDLGVFLGDGYIGNRKLSVTCADPQMIEAMETKPTSVSTSHREGPAREYLFSAEDKRKLWALGLKGVHSWDKFIPKRYLVAPLSIRWELMRGLMDTDGTASKTGRCSFTSVSEQLAKDVQFLARSLGFKALISTKTPSYSYLGERKQGRLAYTVAIRGDDHTSLFGLERKKTLAAPNFNGGQSQRSRKLLSIEFSRDAECQCIKVDHPNGIYLTNDFVVTHNTESLCIEAIGGDDQNIFNNRNWKVLMVRRTFPELENSIISRHKDLIERPGYGKYDGVKHVLKVPNGGEIRYRHIKNEDDLTKFQSDEYVKIIFDELTTFTKRMFLFLFSRLRSRDANIKPMIRSASNPGSLGHGWVKERYITGRKPEEVYSTDVTLPDGRVTSWSQCFIPSNVFDNKFLMESDPLYARRLMELPEVEKQAFLYGNWDIFSGQFFTEFTEDHVVDDFDVPSDWPIWLSLDWGYQTKCAVLFFTENPETKEVYLFHEIYVSKVRAEAVAELIKGYLGARFTLLRGLYTDKRVKIQDDDTSISTQEKFAFAGLYFQVVDTGHENGWHRTRELLLTDKEGRPHFFVFRSCANFIRVMPEMVHDPKNPEDMDKRSENHIPDALRYYAVSRHPTEAESSTPIPFSSVTGYMGMIGGREPSLRHTIRRLAMMPRDSIRFLDRGVY